MMAQRGAGSARTHSHRAAAAYYAQGKTAEAEDLYRRSIALLESGPRPEHEELGPALNNLGVTCMRQGRATEAARYFQRSVSTLESTRGPGHPELIRPLANLAELHTKTRRYAEAESALQRALAIAEKGLGAGHKYVGALLWKYAGLLRRTKRKSEARALEQRAKPILQEAAFQTPGRHTVDVSELSTRNRRPRGRRTLRRLPAHDTLALFREVTHAEDDTGAACSRGAVRAAHHSGRARDRRGPA